MNNIIDSRCAPNGWEDGDQDFFIAQWIKHGSGVKEAYQACIKVCSIWKDIYTGPEMSSKNMKHRNVFLCLQNLNKQWRLVLPSTLNMEGRNFLEIAIAKAHVVTTCGGIEKTLKAVTNKFECQSFSTVVREFVESGNIYQRTKY